MSFPLFQDFYRQGVPAAEGRGTEATGLVGEEGAVENQLSYPHRCRPRQPCARRGGYLPQLSYLCRGGGRIKCCSIRNDSKRVA